MGNNTYIAIASRTYAEGRICIVSDRISRFLSVDGGSFELWRKILEWTGQKLNKELIKVGVVNCLNIPFEDSLMKKQQISYIELTIDDIINSSYDVDLLYFIGLPDTLQESLTNVLTENIENGMGLLIEAPNQSTINILEGIETIACSYERPCYTNGYWTVDGINSYIYCGNVNFGFYSTINRSSLSSNWNIWMTNIVTTLIQSTTNIQLTWHNTGIEMSSSYSLGIKNGITKIRTSI